MVVLNSEPLSDKKSTWNILTKNPLNYNSLKITKLHDDRVKTESARTKKLKGGGAQNAPHRLFRVKIKWWISGLMLDPLFFLISL